MIPNRIVIRALDNALNEIDAKLRKPEGEIDYRNELREDRNAILEARRFIAENRKDA